MLTHDHKLRYMFVSYRFRCSFGPPQLELDLSVYSPATAATSSTETKTKPLTGSWTFDSTSPWGVNMPPQIIPLTRLYEHLFERLVSSSLGHQSVWACSSLCISALTECKETLTQEPFPHRDRYTVYILLFSVTLRERFLTLSEHT